MTEKKDSTKNEAMKGESLYEDSMLRITSNALIFKHFYFPCGARGVKWDDIESVETKTPTLRNGKWRLWGTSDLLARWWFPLDLRRARRDAIFILKLRGKNKRIGFTVENTHKVEDILRRNNVAVYHESQTSRHKGLSMSA